MHNELFPPDGTFPDYLASERKDRRIDQQTNLPLMRAIASIIPLDKTVIDIGAGTGKIVRKLAGKGYRIAGIDGTKTIEELTDGRIRHANLIEDCSEFHRSADWGLFLEVGEHVEKEFESMLLQQVAQIPKTDLIVSWATPGQRGRHHVNCLWPTEVAALFVWQGWSINVESTKKIREVADEFYNERLLVFRR